MAMDVTDTKQITTQIIILLPCYQCYGRSYDKILYFLYRSIKDPLPYRNQWYYENAYQGVLNIQAWMFGCIFGDVLSEVAISKIRPEGWV